MGVHLDLSQRECMLNYLRTSWELVVIAADLSISAFRVNPELLRCQLSLITRARWPLNYSYSVNYCKSDSKRSLECSDHGNFQAKCEKYYTDSDKDYLVSLSAELRFYQGRLIPGQIGLRFNGDLVEIYLLPDKLRIFGISDRRIDLRLRPGARCLRCVAETV